MAKKKINILLIVVVLGLWGTVSYRYLNRYFSSDSTAQVSTEGKTTVFALRQKDTFELASVARDPFLNRDAEKSVVATRPKTHRASIKRDIKPPAEIVAFPAIGYFGYLRSANQKELVILNVNGKLMKLRAGETRDGIKVVKIHKDSVQVSAAGQVKSIRRNK